jgi:hypothetical protein
VRRLRRSKKSLTIKTHRRAGRGGDMPVKPVRLGDGDGDLPSAATENSRRAAEDEKDALYHAEMADCLSAVGDNNRAVASGAGRPSSEGPRRSSVTSR